MPDNLDTTIPNSLKALSSFMNEVDRFLAPTDLETKIKKHVSIILEEALSNIINYGYDDDKEHTIDVRMAIGEDEVALRIEDDGKPFNPLTVPRLDKSQPPLERKKGGLGIHLVRNLMRSMTYSWRDGKNIFEIWVKR